jgi:hypothetical protein
MTELAEKPDIRGSSRNGDFATVGPGETSLNFRPVGQVKLLPKGCSKRVLNTIDLISPFETPQVS